MPRVMSDPYDNFSCTYCQEDISGLRVKCVQCSEFELCLQCFSAGAEIGLHKNDHSYQFVGSGAVRWTPREELHLLNAIEAYGFGNWEYISKYIETKSPEEVREHYTSRYLEGTIGRLTLTPAVSKRPSLTYASSLDTGPLSPTSSGRLPPLDVTAEEAKQLGYMPLRDDFDSEYANEAEAILSPLSANESDDDLDVALTLAQVDVYTNKLRERARRKRVARDYQLVSQFFNSSRKDKLQKKKASKEERDFQEGMLVFCQFHTAQEHEQFIQNLMREQELKVRLNELYRYRRHGITRHEECAHFEQELFFQNDLAKERNQSMGSSGASLHLPPLFHLQTSTLLRKREKREELALCSTERRSVLGSLGNLWLDKMIAAGVLPSGDMEIRHMSRRLLSEQEVMLCSALGLTPAEYMSLKAVLIKEAGGSSEDSKISVTPIESGVRSFLQTQGWLSA